MGISEYRVGEGNWEVLKAGDEIPEEAEIRVNGKDDFLELILYDDTIIKLYGLTSILVKELAREDFSKKKNTTIFLFTGKIFSRIKSTKGRVFRIETETAIAAVRGTKFGILFSPGEGGELVVTEGTVEVFDPANVFTPLIVKEGYVFKLPSSLGETILEPREASLELLNQYDSSYIKKSEPEVEEIKTPSPQTEKKPINIPTFPSLPGVTGNILNFSIGTENIANNSYYLLCFTPTLTIGDLSFGLYLPFILAASDRYVIETNQSLYNYRDWDFSSPQNSWNALISKIAFLQFRNSLLLLKIGIISDYTLGSGLLVNGYNNNLFFPSERNAGLVFGLDGGFVGFESFAGNIANFEILGGRAFFRPLYVIPIVGKWSIGVSAILDKKPETNSENRVFGYSFDLDLPLLGFKSAGLGFYSSVGTLGYYEASSNQTQLYNGFGMNAGVKGNIFMFIYKMEYKNQFGGFQSGYVDKTYDIERESKFKAFRVVSDLPLTNVIYNGFLVEAGVELSNAIRAIISYEHLFPFGTDPLQSVNNNFHTELKISKNLLKKFYGGFSFDWRSFDLSAILTAITNSNFPPAGSILSAEIFYEVVYGVNLGLEWEKFFERNNGNIEEKVIYGFKMEIIL
ncbi:MAG: FecR family protein [Brevinematia bacterium]